MNNKGFTLIELLAVIIVLSIIGGITFSLVGGSFSKAKDGAEEIFVDTIRDSLDVYLTSNDVKGLNFQVVRNASGNECFLKKTHGDAMIYKATTNFKSVIDSEYHPISQDDLINPSNEVKCNNASNIVVEVYRDADFVYYYKVKRSDFGCLNNNVDNISNLPEGFSC